MTAFNPLFPPPRFLPLRESERDLDLLDALVILDTARRCPSAGLVDQLDSGRAAEARDVFVVARPRMQPGEAIDAFDMHLSFAADAEAARAALERAAGTLRFGCVRDRADATPVQDQAGLPTGAWRTTSVFEPSDLAKGRVARAALYAELMYGAAMHPLERGYVSSWHERFEADCYEVRRNDCVERLQGNRNPFVDSQ